MTQKSKTQKEDHVKELLKQAETGIQDVFESERYKKYLTVMSRFHSYSARNCVLILLQNPEATRVAGYEAWQKKFHRQVQRGEKGIAIVGYTPRKITTEHTKTNSDGSIQLDPEGNPITETVTRQYPAFSRMYVYDISQTKGEPLPELVHELQGDVTGFERLFQTLEEVAPLPIEYGDLPDGAKGMCSFSDGKIVLRPGMSQEQTIKTAIHEIAHAFMHEPKSEQEKTLDRRAKETEAESVAFVTCEHYGIDTSDYSFPYLAGWSSGRELKELSASLDRIQKQAETLITQIDDRLRDLQISRCESHEVEKAEAAIAHDVHEQQEPVESVVGRVSFASGEKYEYKDAAEYIACLQNELPYLQTSGFRYETLTNDPFIRKTVDDMIFGLYGEENPRDIESYQKSAVSKQMLREAYPGCQPNRETPAASMPYKTVERHTAAREPAQRISMRERMVNAQEEAEKRAVAAQMPATPIKEQTRSEQ